ncbi:hypothetical protein [Acidovorax sp.]|uniref:hypothetical protein n=1 Tax=Acidovorax sp. TaxID=1872122 RepID=UPI00391A7C55
MTPAPHTWARHLVAPVGSASSTLPALSAAEAARVQRHRDQLMAALQAHDRKALWCAKQAVLDAAFRPTEPAAGQPLSPALRGALRDLAWRMAGLLLPRGTRNGTELL